jgi:hypothetical protein
MPAYKTYDLSHLIGGIKSRKPQFFLKKNQLLKSKIEKKNNKKNQKKK